MRKSSNFASVLATGTLPALLALSALMFAAGCGGGGAASVKPGPTPNPNPANSASAQVRFGDAPADSIVSFEVSVSALSLTALGGGAAISVPIPANNRIELSHQSGKFEPFAIGGLPQGTFSAANLTLANAELTFLSGAGTPVHINGSASVQVTIPLSPVLTVGSSPLVIDIDVNLAKSVTLSGSTITGISFGPSSFTVAAKAPAAQAEQEDDDGEIEDVQGLVTAVNGSNFTMNVGQTGSSLTFATDGTTEFKDGLAGVAGLTNQIVTVEGFTRADGSLFAKEVEGQESQTGAEVEGMITAISGTILTVTAQDGIGAGMDNSKVGETFTVNIAGLSASKFRVKSGDGFASEVPASLVFDSTTIHQGQRIEVETGVPMPPANGAITPDKIDLQQQGISGTVSNLAPDGSTFDLTLGADSALAVISAKTVVHVTKVASTDTRVTVADNASARVRGLLFWNGTSWQMVARRIR